MMIINKAGDDDHDDDKAGAQCHAVTIYSKRLRQNAAENMTQIIWTRPSEKF